MLYVLFATQQQYSSSFDWLFDVILDDENGGEGGRGRLADETAVADGDER